jgi:hypothetical protein
MLLLSLSGFHRHTREGLLGAARDENITEGGVQRPFGSFQG